MLLQHDSLISIIINIYYISRDKSDAGFYFYLALIGGLTPERSGQEPISNVIDFIIVYLKYDKSNLKLIFVLDWLTNI